MLQSASGRLPSFLEGGGECGRLIAKRDWSGSLGPIDQWCHSLRTATAIVLASPVPMVMLWGEDGIMIYNDAYSVFAAGRHPDLLGSKVREGWPEVADFNDHVMKVGLAGGTLQFRDQELTLHRHGYPEPVWMNLDYSPVPGDDGAPAGVLAVVIETSVRVLAEKRFRLRFELDEQLRSSSTPEQIAERASRLVSEQMNGCHVGYAEVEDEGAYVRTLAAWRAGEPAPHVGQRHRTEDFGAHFAEACLGRDVVVADVATDPRTCQAAERFRTLGVGSFMLLPLVKEEQFGGYFFAVSDGPRQWSDPERGLLREVAERAWASMRRSRAEQALRASQEHLAAIFNQTSAGIAEADISGRLINVNDRYCEMLGRSREELLTLSIADVTHPDDLPANREMIQRLVQTGESFRLEKRYLRSDKSTLWVSNDVTLIQRGLGQPPTILAVSIGITDRKAAERALRESEERFRNMADNTPVMMWVTDPTGYCTYLNKRWYEFTGQGEREGEGLGWVQAVHPDDRPVAEKAFLDANGRQEDYRVEFRLRRADGVYRWTLDAAAARFDETGNFMGYVGSVVDIDDRREAEMAVRNSEELLRSVIEQMPVGVAVARVPTGDIFLYNEALETMLAHPILSEDAATYNRYGGIDEEGKPLPVDGYPLYRAVVQGETVADHEMRYRRGDGEIIQLLGNAARVIGSDGLANIAVVTLQDITERKRAERHQRLLIDELSHRAKNLLAIIQSVAQQSFKGANDPGEMLRSFEGRLGALAAAHGVLTQEKWESAPVRRIICDTVTAVKADDERLVLEGPDVLVPPKTGVSLAMAVHELVTNALKYGSFSNAAGRVMVKWQAEDGRLKLEWREEGGPPVASPERRGFGSRMIERALAAELGGTVRIDFRPEGVVCTVDAPMPEMV